MIQRLLDYQLSVKQLIGIAVLLAFPYLLIGLFWALNHSEHLEPLQGLDYLFSLIGEVIAWPPLIISDITLK